MEFKKRIKNFVAPYRLFWGYITDLFRFKNYSYEFNKRKMSRENIRAEITFQYHAIEKGLSHDKLRLGFGKKKIERLLNLLNMWENRGYPTTDRRYLTAVSVLKRYIQVHEESNFNISKIKNEILFLDGINTKNPFKGGEVSISKSFFEELRNENFEKFSSSRRSIRNFGEKEVSINRIKDAVRLATNYPSVCNRQSVNTYVVHNKDIMRKCLEIQNGIQGMGNNASAVLIITSDNQYFGNLNERNESFIDGGIFSMNLLYSLTYNDIASCALNANLNTKRMKKIRNLVGIPNSEDIVMFMICGSYPEKCKFPVSIRDSVEDVITILE